MIVLFGKSKFVQRARAHGVTLRQYILWMLELDSRGVLSQLSLPDDIREKGWKLLVHFDRMVDGERVTCWQFGSDQGCISGEGRTDMEALEIIRRKLERKEALTPIARVPA